MNICLNLIIEKDCPVENFLSFMSGLKSSKGDFSLCIVNNSSNRFTEIEKYKNCNNIHIIWNNIDVGFVTAVNQSLYYSSSISDYSFIINCKYAVIVNPNWILSSLNNLGKESLGGHLFPVKITNSELVKKLLYNISPNDVSWLSNWLNQYMVISSINSNIFLVKNSFLSKINYPDSNFCSNFSYGLSLSLSFMKNGMAPVSLKNIYSSNNDDYRYDIFSVIKNGAEIIYPVTIDSVRKKLQN